MMGESPYGDNQDERLQRGTPQRAKIFTGGNSKSRAERSVSVRWEQKNQNRTPRSWKKPLTTKVGALITSPKEIEFTRTNERVSQEEGKGQKKLT